MSTRSAQQDSIQARAHWGIGTYAGSTAALVADGSGKRAGWRAGQHNAEVPHPGSLQSPRLQLVPEHSPGLHLQNKGRTTAGGQGGSVTTRPGGHCRTALFSPFGCPGAAGRLLAEQGRSPVLSHACIVTIVSLVIGVHSLMDPGSWYQLLVVHLSVESVDNADQECIFLSAPSPVGCLSVAGECLCFPTRQAPKKEQNKTEALTTPFLWGCSSCEQGAISVQSAIQTATKFRFRNSASS